MSRRKITNDPRAPELIRLYQTGLPITECAKRLGMGCERASGLLTAAGIPIRRSEPWPAAKVDRLLRLRESGWTWVQISVDLCTSPDTARKTYRRHVAEKTVDMIPPAHVVIGPMTYDRAELARRVAEEIERLGAVVLLQHRGRLVTTVPGSPVAEAAEDEGAVVATYVEGVDAQWIEDDIAEVCL